MENKITHKQLVDSAVKWLRNFKRCPVVIKELVTYAGEIPDAIGFLTNGVSILVECKASRADFMRDKEKVYRYCSIGMGDERYYCVPKGLLKIEELPENWGLIEVFKNPIHKYNSVEGIRNSVTFTNSNKHSEITMLLSAIRRLEKSTAVFIREEEKG